MCLSITFITIIIIIILVKYSTHFTYTEPSNSITYRKHFAKLRVPLSSEKEFVILYKWYLLLNTYFIGIYIGTEIYNCIYSIIFILWHLTPFCPQESVLFYTGSDLLFKWWWKQSIISQTSYSYATSLLKNA